MATFIFDFDGTLADSFPIVADILLKQAGHLNCKQLTSNEIKALKGLHAREVLRYLDVPLWKSFLFVKKFRKLNLEKVTEVIIFPEWFEVLKKLKFSKNQLGIISSNSGDTIKFVLQKHGLVDLFDFIIGEQPLFRKAHCLRKIIKRLSLDKNTTYYVGDEVRDIEAAQANQIRAIAVAWGFNSLERLQLAKPELLITNLKELSDNTLDQ